MEGMPTLVIERVNIVEDWLINSLALSISERFNFSVTARRSVSLGEVLSFFDERRGQVKAEELIRYLTSRIPSTPSSRILALVDADAYVDDLNFVFGIAREDWGGVVFTRRLRPEFYGQPSNKILFTARVVKEALHELGHSLGLPHCRVRSCVMNFSNSVIEVDGKSPNFCRRCSILLEKAYPGLLKAAPF